VDTPLALEALDADGGVDDRLDVVVPVVELTELAALVVALVRGIEDLLQRDVLAHHRRRHRLGDPVAHREGVAEDARGVLDGLLGLDGAVGDDHRDPVVAVLVGDVADHLTAPALVEVDVEVGHRDAVGVQEALEDQAVLERVEVGDPHGIGAHRARTRATARADADAVVLGPVDEVGDDEEVAGEAHAGDDAGLEVGLLAYVVGDAVGVAEPQPLLDLLDEPGVLVLPLGDREARHVGAVALGELDVAALGDQQGVVARLGQPVAVGPQLTHLGGGLDVVAVALELEPLGVAHRAAGGDAEQVLLGGSVLLEHVVGVVGRDGRDAEVLGEPQQALADTVLDAQPVVHQLEEVVVLAEDVLEVAGCLTGLVVVADAQPRLHLARGASGRGDQPVGVLRQELAVGAWLVEEALHRRPRGEPEQVVHALGRLGEQGHVGVGTGTGDVVVATVVPAHPLLVEARGVGREVGLHADDRLDPRRASLGPEVVGPEHVAVVGHRDRAHAQLGGPLEHVSQPRRTVQHGVLGVDVEVDETVPAGGPK
jgi:hypothetical protein